MLLVIDAGNTNITLGVFRGADLLAQWRLTTDRDRSGDEYGAELRNLFERTGIDLKEIEAVAIASVVPPLNQALKRMVEDLFWVDAVVRRSHYRYRFEDSLRLAFRSRRRQNRRCGRSRGKVWRSVYRRRLWHRDDVQCGQRSA